MEQIIWRLLTVAFAVLALHYWNQVRKAKEQLRQASGILDEILEGNLDRRILDSKGSLTAEVCFKINGVVIKQKEQSIANQKSESAYRRLVTSLSHDLRTPLASLTGYLEVLANGMATAEEIPDYLNTSIRKTSELKEYVNTLFEWMKLESGEKEYQFEEYDICELTREIAASWIPVFEGADMEAEVQIPETEILAELDREAYIRITENLLQNVRKHSGAARCELTVRQEHKKVILEISDNGKGIREENMDYIFTRLYQEDASRSAGGSGLGLAIVKELTEAQGGKVRVESIPGYKTSFIAEFPVKTL